MKKLFIAIILIFSALFILVWQHNSLKQAKIPLLNKDYEEVKLNKFYNTGFKELKSEIINSLKKPVLSAGGKQAKIGIISHHLPTALPLISNFYNNLRGAVKGNELFIILGPDHKEKCKYKISVTKNSFLTPFGELKVDANLNEQLIRAGAGIDENCFRDEHSIGVQAVFIKYLFPEARIVPLLFSSSANNEDLEKIKLVLAKQQDAFIVGSVDFSHHFRYEEAETIDKESENIIKNLVENKFDLKQVDSPPIMNLVINLARAENLEPLILERKNSFNYNFQKENSTGYISALFKIK